MKSNTYNNIYIEHVFNFKGEKFFEIVLDDQKLYIAVNELNRTRGVSESEFVGKQLKGISTADDLNSLKVHSLRETVRLGMLEQKELEDYVKSLSSLEVKILKEHVAKWGNESLYNPISTLMMKRIIKTMEAGVQDDK